MIEPHGMLEMYDIAREMRATYEEQIILNLWDKGLMPQRIADETGLDLSKVEDIIECEENYAKAM